MAHQPRPLHAHQAFRKPLPDGLREISHQPPRDLHEQHREHGFKQDQPSIKHQHPLNAGGEVQEGENGIQKFLIFVGPPLSWNSKSQQRDEHGNAEKIDNAVDEQANNHQHPPPEGDETKGGEYEGGGQSM